MPSSLWLVILVVYTALWIYGIVDCIQRRRFGMLAFLILFPGLGVLVWGASRIAGPPRRTV